MVTGEPGSAGISYLCVALFCCLWVLEGDKACCCMFLRLVCVLLKAKCLKYRLFDALLPGLAATLETNTMPSSRVEQVQREGWLPASESVPHSVFPAAFVLIAVHAAVEPFLAALQEQQSQDANGRTGAAPCLERS